MKLKDKTVVITGGGSGIGLRIVRLFADHSANIIIADINTEVAKSNVKNIKGNIDIQKADVSVRSEIEAAIDFAVSKYGRLDILVNNAGILDKMTPIGEIEDSLWNKVMDVNLNGVMYASRHAVKIMEKQNGGNIINIASVCGVQGGRAGVAYTASKHVLWDFLKILPLCMLTKTFVAILFVRVVLKRTFLQRHFPMQVHWE